MKYISLVLAVFFFSCKASKDQSKNDVKSDEVQQAPVKEQVETKSDGPLETLIIGEWEWVKTICCGRTPHTETAESLPAPRVLKFQKGGALEYFSGTEKKSDQTYKISYGLMSDDKRPVVTMGAKQPALLQLEGDSMIIDYGYIDLQTEYYVRKK